jgi:LysR substrate binding domain
MPGGAAELTRPVLMGLAAGFPHVQITVRHVSLVEWSESLVDEVDLLVASPPWPDRELLATELLTEPVVVAYPSTFIPEGPAELSLERALDLPMARFADSIPGRVVDYWNLSWAANGSGDYQAAGRQVRGPTDTHAAIMAGECAAFRPAWATRLFHEGYSVARLAGDHLTGVRLLSRPDCPEVVHAMHEEAGHITREVGRWFLGSPASRSVLAELGL